MSNIKCKICGEETNLINKLIIKKKYEAEYYSCKKCNFLFVNNPTWITESYEKPINITDVGYVMRNVYLSKITLILFTLFFGKKNNYLDYAGGYGIMTRLMRDYGLNFFNYDLYTQNLFAQGFEYNKQPTEAITCFECFEHFLFPNVEIEKILKISKNIFFSTRVLPEKIPDETWEYYGLEHGQHISFYSLKTLNFIAKKYNLNYYTNNNNLHLFTAKKKSSLIFKLILISAKLQIDIIIRKLLKSKTMSDFNLLKNKI